MKFSAIPLALLLAAAAPAQEAAKSTESFDSLPAGPPPDTLMVIEGSWGIVEDGANRVLELHAEPVVDAAILVGPSFKAGATIQAKARAAKSRRAFPRLGVGLYGVSGVKLRLVPAQKKVELLAGEEVIADAPFEAWTENAWWRIELSVSGAGDDWTAEARVWSDGAERPTTATLSKKLPGNPGQGRASVLGSPYANKPVQFDDVTVAAAGGPG